MRVKLALVAAVARFALATSAAQATVHTYFGPEWGRRYGVANKSGWNWPTTNRVYRLLLLDLVHGRLDGFKRNYWDNPLVWPYAGGYARSVCAHSDNELQGIIESRRPVTSLGIFAVAPGPPEVKSGEDHN